LLFGSLFAFHITKNFVFATMVILRALFLLLATVVACALAGGTNPEGLAFLAANAKKEGVITLESGLQYKVLKRGSGTAHPMATTSCLCHYKGELISGEQFDSSYDRGEPSAFSPAQVIKGWTEAMQLMVEGDKWEMYIPSELGYGDRGSPPKIPGGAVLVFVMELIEIQGDSVEALRCDAATGESCDEKELAFIGKMKTKDSTAVAKELARISGMKGGKMKPELKAWLARRIAILQQMVGDPKDL
jgi:hypothetical protein